MDVVKETDKMVSVHFDGVTDLLEFTPPKKHKRDFYKSIRDRTGKPAWFGSSNKKASEVIEKALLGDSKLYETLQRNVAELDKLTGYHTKSYQQVIQHVRRKKIKGSYGDELDIHAVYQGRLDTAWTRTHRVEVDSVHHLVTLLIDLGGASREDAADSI